MVTTVMSSKDREIALLNERIETLTREHKEMQEKLVASRALFEDNQEQKDERAEQNKFVQGNDVVS